MAETVLKTDNQSTDIKTKPSAKKLLKLSMSDEGRLKIDNLTDSYLKFGTSDSDSLGVIVNQIANLINTGNGPPDRTDMDEINAGLAFVVEMKPQDPTEMFLASQMFAIQNLAMDTARRTVFKDQAPEARNQYMDQTIKLMRTFTTQVEALAKYRTKGKQKITVQHVNVENGGQAIVGDVSQGGGSD
jgi:hypothetical protein